MSIGWETLLQPPDYEWHREAPGASEQDLARLAASLRHPLPEAYAALVRLSDGTTIRHRTDWRIRLWRTSDAQQWARAYGVVPERIPNAFAFADDGGDGGYLFDLRFAEEGGELPIYTLDFTSISWADAFKVADSFRSLLLHGPQYPQSK